jgi:hypothetical protein
MPGRSRDDGHREGLRLKSAERTSHTSSLWSKVTSTSESKLGPPGPLLAYREGEAVWPINLAEDMRKAIELISGQPGRNLPLPANSEIKI